MRIAARLILLLFRLCPLAKEWRSTDNGHTDNEKTVGKFGKLFPTVSLSSMFWWSVASMPSGQILYLMMFVGKCSCTSHVLQYSSSRSYEHSRSLQSSLCPEVVTVLICWASLHVFSPRQSWCEHLFVRMAWRKRSFFVAALLLIYRNLENGGKIIHIFTNRQTFSYLFCIFYQYFHSFYLLSHEFFVILHPKASRAVIFGWTRQPSKT